jgi:large subunit ribosomal protein L25
VAGERVKLEVQQRETRGSAASRRLRRQGLIPGVLYGRGQTPHPFCVPERDLRKALTGPAGLHAILDVVLDGQKTSHASILKDYQQDVISGRLAHIDLQEVRLDQPIQAQVVIELVGEAQGSVEGDVSAMQMGDTLRLSEVAVQEGVKFLDDPEETVIATVTVPTQIVEPEPEEEVELEEGVELPEGEEAPEGVAEGEAPAEGEEAGAGESGEPGTSEG